MNRILYNDCERIRDHFAEEDVPLTYPKVREFIDLLELLESQGCPVENFVFIVNNQTQVVTGYQMVEGAKPGTTERHDFPWTGRLIRTIINRILLENPVD